MGDFGCEGRQSKPNLLRNIIALFSFFFFVVAREKIQLLPRDFPRYCLLVSHSTVAPVLHNQLDHTVLIDLVPDRFSLLLAL